MKRPVRRRGPSWTLRTNGPRNGVGGARIALLPTLSALCSLTTRLPPWSLASSVRPACSAPQSRSPQGGTARCRLAVPRPSAQLVTPPGSRSAAEATACFTTVTSRAPKSIFNVMKGRGVRPCRGLATGVGHPCGVRARERHGVFAQTTLQDTWFQTRFAGGLPFTDLPEFPRRLPRDRFRLRDHLREASTESPQGCTGEGVGGWLSSTIYRQPSSRPPVYRWGGGVERFRQTLSGFKPKSRDLPERALLGDLGGAMGVDLPGQRGEAEKRLVYRSQVYRSLSSPRQESNRYIERIGREGQ